MTIQNHSCPTKALTNNTKLEVTKTDANSPAGLLNEGYWGFAVRPNTQYSGSFFAKTSASGALTVRIALVADESGKVLATASAPVSGSEWKRYEFQMRSGDVAPGAENHLELLIDRPGTLRLQLVLLFRLTSRDWRC